MECVRCGGGGKDYWDWGRARDNCIRTQERRHRYEAIIRVVVIVSRDEERAASRLFGSAGRAGQGRAGRRGRNSEEGDCSQWACGGRRVIEVKEISPAPPGKPARGR